MLLYRIRKIKKIVAVAAGLCLLATTMPYIAYGNVSKDLLDEVPVPKETSIDTTKEGLVEIQSGLEYDGKFYEVRKCNGFLVSNREGQVYVVTTRHGIRITGEDRRETGASENASPSVRIIVRGDVVSELSVEAISKKQDFCVLMANDVVQSKGTVTLRDTGGEEGEQVHVLGFPSGKKSSNIQYDPSDVKDIEGQTLVPTKVNGTSYIRHTAKVSKGFDGSVLVDENGFVIGMNNYAKSKKDKSYALNISAVEKVLDDFGIPYATNLTEQAYAQLYYRCEQGIKQSNQSRYKADSKAAMETELVNSVSVLTETPYDLDKLVRADERLADAQKSLKRKISKLIWVVIILGAAIIALLVRFLKLLLWRRKTGLTTKPVEKEPSVKTTPKQYLDENEAEKTIVSRETWSPGWNSNEKDAFRTVSLYWSRMGEQIHIDKPEFVIGKKKDAVDFAIEDNRMISRIHASIQTGSQGCRVIDLRSSNGTYVNGQKVPDTGVVLQDGDLLKLANEEFIVEIS